MSERAEFENDLAAVLVRCLTDESGTLEMTQTKDGWSFTHQGKLSTNHPTLGDAIQAMKDGYPSLYELI